MLTSMTNTTSDQERSDFLEALAMHRGLLRRTADGLSDEQARLRSTTSELSIGGIVKHVAATEARWAQFMVDGTGMDVGVDWSKPDPDAIAAYRASFALGDDETLAGALERYDQVAAATDELVRTLDDFDRSFPLPAAPWFPKGATRSARRTIQHIIAETAQHAGHADIIRESIDGATSMG
jgi:uncharacterized damage-inducible protein DinB